MYELIMTMMSESGLGPAWTWLSSWLAFDARQLIFMVATPVFIGVTVWEYRRIRHDSRLMDLGEAFRNFGLGAGYQVTELLFAGIIAFPVYALVYHYRILDLELNWYTALLVLLGVAYAMSLVYQFFIHTTLVGRLHPWVEMIFNTPSHHRVHHGRNPQYIDQNYGGVLIVWDRLFGTFVAEDSGNQPEYGITRQIHSNNLLRLWTHEYADLFRDMRRPGKLSSRMKHLWMPPDWERTD